MSGQIPTTQSVRLATLADLPRIGLVAVAGFHHTDRRYADMPFVMNHVNSILTAYSDSYRRDVLDSKSVVLVVEDVLEPNEVDAVHAQLAKQYPPLADQLPPTGLNSGRAVVGVCSLSLQAGSVRVGQYQPEGQPSVLYDSEPHDPDDDSMVAGLLAGRMTIDTMVVHPAYWRRGYATAIAKCIMELADEDQTGLGVEASDMGTPFFQQLGFKRAPNPQAFQESGDELGRPQLWIGIRDPAART